MRKFWMMPTVGLIGLLVAGQGNAADMATPDTIIEAPAVSAAYNWSGVYVGVSGGYLDPNLRIGFGATEFDFGDSGYLVGGTVGYNHQFGNVVVGIEGDLSYADIDGSTGDLFGFFPGNDVTSAEADYFGTIRGRLGFAFDRALVYGTGGVAFTDIDYQTAAGSFSESDTGYTVGGGLEYGFTENFSAKIEYLYADFGSSTTEQFPGDINTDVDMNIVRVGLNYRF